jgi:hypothetical protein
MPDDLYHRDILAWSKAQAERLAASPPASGSTISTGST